MCIAVPRGSSKVGATTPTSKKRPANSVTSWLMRGPSTTKSTMKHYETIDGKWHVNDVNDVTFWGGVRERDTSWALDLVDSARPLRPHSGWLPDVALHAARRAVAWNHWEANDRDPRER